MLQPTSSDPHWVQVATLIGCRTLSLACELALAKEQAVAALAAFLAASSESDLQDFKTAKVPMFDIAVLCRCWISASHST